MSNLIIVPLVITFLTAVMLIFVGHRPYVKRKVVLTGFSLAFLVSLSYSYTLTNQLDSIVKDIFITLVFQ